VEILKDQEIDLILLAGYMKIIGATVLSKYKGKIINVHPYYLPDFAGSPHAIEESHEAKKGLGISIHYVDEGVDTGELIAQISLAYHEDLEVYERSVHEAEHKLYPEVVRQIILHQQ
jgi:phosphoribosylglycinamide formyltransferase-1